jgi:hypothetical protein
MSLVPHLGKNYEKLPGILDQFKEELKPAKEQYSNEGKLLENCLSKNSAQMHYYDERRIRLHSLVKFFKLERDRVRSDLYRKYNENYSRTLTVQLLSKYVDGEDDYIFVNKLLLEVEEVYEEYVSVVDTFKQRHYELTNMTKLRIANLEFSEI